MIVPTNTASTSITLISVVTAVASLLLFHFLSIICM